MNDFDPFAGGAIERSVDSTEAQREIWLAARFGGDQASIAYNESITLELSGIIETEILRSATQRLVTRHDALRSTFSEDGQSLVVNAEPDLDFEVLDLRKFSNHEKQSLRLSARDREVNASFDLLKGPLIRFRLLQLADDSQHLILSAHHIVCDGWSLGVLVTELSAMCSTESNTDLATAPSFVTHAIAERKSLYGKLADTTELYWIDKLGHQPHELDLPTDHSRSSAMIEVDGVPTRNLSAVRLDRDLNADLANAARELARTSGAGLSATLLTAFAILLSRLAGQQDFIIGVPAAAQAHSGEFGLVGHCVQMLPIRIQCDDSMTVTALAQSIKKSLTEGFDNQGLAFGTLLQRLRLERDASRIPLIPVMFNLDQEFDVNHLGDCDMKVVSNPRRAENFDIFLNITPEGKQLKLEATFRTGLFDNSTIDQWLESFEATLDSAVGNPDGLIEDVRSLSKRQHDHQLTLWNQFAVLRNPQDSNTTLARIIDAASLYPDRIAIQDKNESVSYSELIRRSEVIAWQLIQDQAKPGSYVGICRSPGVDLVAGLIGIWLAGCAYIPLDPDYPESRLRYIIRDTRVKLILGEGSSIPGFATECNWLQVDGKAVFESDKKLPLPSPGDVAYIIHTSGSTGEPKGVEIEHAALDNFMNAMARRPGMNSEAILLAVTSLSFDISTLEIFLPLTLGAKVVMASRQQVRDSFALIHLIDSCSINYIQATPSGWRTLLDADWKGNKNLKALCGGEELSPTLARELAPRVGTLWNMYGPTEATVWSTVEQIMDDPHDITLGRPIDSTTAFVLDEKLNLLPPGAVGGELYLGGAGIARGYLNREELTAERFPINPFTHDDGSRLYRTGDRVRLDSSDHLHFLGRTDHQVKIRGFRVELGEIESTLAKAPGVGTVVATVKIIGEGDSRLVAYITSGSAEIPDTDQLLTLAGQQLPAQCVPQHIVLLEEFPQTANGKLDRSALPDPVVSSAKAPVELTTDTQRKLAELWRELLRINTVGAQDDFFLSGGHSMLAVRMLSRIRELFGLELPLQTIFQDRNIENLAARINLLEMSIEPHNIESEVEVIEF